MLALPKQSRTKTNPCARLPILPSQLMADLAACFIEAPGSQSQYKSGPFGGKGIAHNSMQTFDSDEH